MIDSHSEWAIRWPSFRPQEILSTTQLKLFEERGVIVYSFRALDKLEIFRKRIAVPLLINHGDLHLRGARSLKEVFETNSATRGADEKWGYSFHLWCAFDISSPQLTPIQLRQEAIESKLWGGIGLYDSFVHIDDRDHFGDTPALWDYRKSK